MHRAHCFAGEVTEEVESCPYPDWGSVLTWAESAYSEDTHVFWSVGSGRSGFW